MDQISEETFIQADDNFCELKAQLNNDVSKFMKKVEKIKMKEEVGTKISEVSRKYAQEQRKIQSEYKPKVLDDIKAAIKRKPIKCKKYNYSLDDCVQNFKHFEAKITFNESLTDLLILNKKYDGRDSSWVKSSASCPISEIKGILYGGISSRFWMLRKHINSIPSENMRTGHVPFYSWQCVTLQMENKDVDLVIQNE